MHGHLNVKVWVVGQVSKEFQCIPKLSSRLHTLHVMWHYLQVQCSIDVFREVFENSSVSLTADGTALTFWLWVKWDTFVAWMHVMIWVGSNGLDSLLVAIMLTMSCPLALYIVTEVFKCKPHSVLGRTRRAQTSQKCRHSCIMFWADLCEYPVAYLMCIGLCIVSLLPSETRDARVHSPTPLLLHT